MFFPLFLAPWHPHFESESIEKCGVDEEFYQCTPNCKNTCENIQNPTALCQCGPPGCFCKRGLVKRADGKCVPPNQCPAKCGKDEQYYQCTPSCKNTCENFHNPRVRCRCGPPGCFCREGLVRRADGKCVSPNQCPARCGVDEQYYECTPTCKSTCDNFANLSIPCSCAPPGCSCKKGLIRRADGKCVRPNQCPVKCAVDEQYYTCTPLCKNTCENFDNPRVRCQCGPPGCFCRAGLVRRADGKCVRPNQCPVKCGTNERYYQCTPSCKNTCENFYNPGVRCQCGPPGCFCRDGLVRRSDGRCIIPSQCPAKCSVDEEGLVKTEDGRCVNPTQCIKKPSRCQENAEYLTCGPSCRPTCKNPYTGSCPTRCVPGCFCKPGFVESHDGRCVHLERCEKRCQYPEEEFQECGTTCPETCENRGHPHPGSCPFRCNRGCFCKKGLVRTKEGTCVPLSDCPGSTVITPVIVGPIRIQPHPVPAPRSLPDDCYGCPDRSQCSIHCRSQGSYTGICVGDRQLHCKCL
ncbi:zonadhesin [Trichonephila clavata]|uniref:Zonadhesin n=1 Tax=Trichonephila clavata TaxID=2740835 RepID=A0A8X6FUE6_TRICU|nr:zonadhesin [Trichonephila clavata]